MRVPGVNGSFNKSLEFASRVADYMELGELMARDALHREESCGGHFREEYQTPEGEALRNDQDYAYVAAWEYAGDIQLASMHRPRRRSVLANSHRSCTRTHADALTQPPMRRTTVYADFLIRAPRQSSKNGTMSTV